MTTAEFLKRVEQERELREQLLQVNPYLTDNSGIYVFTREDENGFKYAYVGQAKHILSRLVEHMKRAELHIEKSLRKHKLWNKDNLYGWRVSFFDVKEDALDSEEKKYIKVFADNGYQLRNKTLGGQGKGKTAIGEMKTCKGYYDGKRQGRADIAKQLRKVTKHLKIEPANEGKLAKRMLAKFWEILEEDDSGDEPLSE